MKQTNTFLCTVCALAVPAALQSMLQASFSIVDQVMIGQLGSVSVAGVGLAGKFASIYTVLISAIGAAAGILIAQYLGQEDGAAVRRSFWIDLALGCGVAVLFMAACVLLPGQIMGLYTQDAATRQAAAEYLAVIALGFLPTAGTTLCAALFRCAEKARLPLYASIVSALMNTGLNYLLIFGKCGLPALGAVGAAWATVLSQFGGFVMMCLMLPRCGISLRSSKADRKGHFAWGQYAAMLVPMLVCEVLWSLGENVYAIIYGHLGTQSTAAMTLINPVQGIVIGALCGLSQAAGVLIGKRLGSGEYDRAYQEAKKLIWYGAVGAVALSVAVVLTSGAYVQIYQVEPEVRHLTRQILFAYALVAPFKVLNMIIGGGILRSGGQTRLAMMIDIVGTWGFGVPMGLLAAFVLELPVPAVYFLLSLEEALRVAISAFVFRKKEWMRSLE